MGHGRRGKEFVFILHIFLPILRGGNVEGKKS